MKRGSVTVFLSMIFILMISFITGILEISSLQISKNMSRLETDRAIFSVFGEYQKELMKAYHVFGLEGSYGTGNYREENLIKKMHYYGSASVEHEIKGIQYLTDNQGQPFREQVLAYMEQRYGISLVSDLTGLTAKWKEQEIQGQEMGNRKSTVLGEYQTIKEPPPAETGNGQGEEISEERKAQLAAQEADRQAAIDTGDRAFNCINTVENKGVLALVLPKEMMLSGKAVQMEKQASVRTLRTGRGEFPMRQSADGVTETLMFNEYILQQFDCAVKDSGVKTNGSTGNGASGSSGTSKKTDVAKQAGKESKTVEPSDGEERSLSYEVEYIIAGKNSDRDNLESVLMQIFLIRMGLNYKHLMSDPEKKSQAQAMAATITALLLKPHLIEVFKHLLIFAWAAGESAVDIRAMLSGRKVALEKSKDTWQLSLSSLLTLGTDSDTNGGGDDKNGLGYQDYLRILLFIKNRDEVTMRTIDRVEENLIICDKLTFFQADQCVTKLELNNTARILDQITYKFPVYFGYS